MTPVDTLRQLIYLYKTAAVTGTRNHDPHYEELADDIHSTIRSIIQGVDPSEAVNDLAAYWGSAAADTPDGPAAIRTYWWPNTLKAVSQ